MKHKWIIQDWTGTRKWPKKEFNSFDDGWSFLYQELPKVYPEVNFNDEKQASDVYGEYYVERKE
jgi:hypothetical protein